MAHWPSLEVTGDKLRKAFPQYGDVTKFAVSVVFKDLGWEGLCGFHITISSIAQTPYAYVCQLYNIRILEQPGCCGVGNLFYCHHVGPGTAQEAYDISLWVARELRLAWLKYAGTSYQNEVITCMKKDGWKYIGDAPNSRYAQKGNTIHVLAKKLNVFRRGKGSYAHRYGY
jgi:hypothetical protein